MERCPRRERERPPGIRIIRNAVWRTGEMKVKNQPVSIAVVGSGYVGLVAAACFAEIGHRVVCVDNDESKVRTLKQGGIPIHEEHLPELLERHRGRSLE